jgi:ubiquinol-cytochrome c reductase cytochrome c1 subunit
MSEVCSACHSMNLVPFRTLEDLGYSEEQVKALAANYEVEDGPNADGEMFTRTAVLTDHFPAPFPNKEAAACGQQRRDSAGLLADLAKARYVERGFPQFVSSTSSPAYNESGPNYIYSLLTGYGRSRRRPCRSAGRCLNYNPYFNAGSLRWLWRSRSMMRASPMTTARRKRSTSIRKDVAAFLMWAAEPHMEERKQTGFMVIIFLVIFSSLLFLTKKSVFASKEH